MNRQAEDISTLTAKVTELLDVTTYVKCQVDSFDQIYKRPCADHMILRENVKTLTNTQGDNKSDKKITKQLVIEAVLQLIAIIIASIITTSTMFNLQRNKYESQSYKNRVDYAQTDVFNRSSNKDTRK
jgi:hypothetical protein